MVVNYLREVVEHGVLTPLPEQPRRGERGDGQQTDSEDANTSLPRLGS
jgi:hypothetical protein